MNDNLLPDETIDRQLAATNASIEAMAAMMQAQRLLAEAAMELGRTSFEAAMHVSQRVASTGLDYTRRTATVSGESMDRLAGSVTSTLRTDRARAGAGVGTTPARSPEAAA